MAESQYGPPAFASAGIRGAHLARCWPCITGQHPGGDHRWADSEDIAHAASIGKPESAEGVCGCRCVNEPEQDGPDEPPDYMPLAIGTCYTCGAEGACAYDEQGRALIHADGAEEDDQ